MSKARNPDIQLTIDFFFFLPKLVRGRNLKKKKKKKKKSEVCSNVIDITLLTISSLFFAFKEFIDFVCGTTYSFVWQLNFVWKNVKKKRNMKRQKKVTYFGPIKMVYVTLSMVLQRFFFSSSFFLCFVDWRSCNTCKDYCLILSVCISIACVIFCRLRCSIIVIVYYRSILLHLLLVYSILE